MVDVTLDGRSRYIFQSCDSLCVLSPHFFTKPLTLPLILSLTQPNLNQLPHPSYHLPYRNPHGPY